MISSTRVFTIKSERDNFSRSFLLAYPKTRLADFSMHDFVNVSPILWGFFVRAIKYAIPNDASTASADACFRNASLLTMFILLNDFSLASKNSKSSCFVG